jgi:hypothetical protein
MHARYACWFRAVLPAWFELGPPFESQRDGEPNVGLGLHRANLHAVHECAHDIDASAAFVAMRDRFPSTVVVNVDDERIASARGANANDTGFDENCMYDCVYPAEA